MDVEHVKTENPFASLFDTEKIPRKGNKHGKWGEELDAYKQEPRLDMDGDPLLWWKVNEKRFPVLCMRNFCND